MLKKGNTGAECTDLDNERLTLDWNLELIIYWGFLGTSKRLHDFSLEPVRIKSEAADLLLSGLLGSHISKSEEHSVSGRPPQHLNVEIIKPSLDRGY